MSRKLHRAESLLLNPTERAFMAIPNEEIEEMDRELEEEDDDDEWDEW